MTTAPSCGGLPAELECTGSYSLTLTQQNISLDSQSFKLDPFRQGLTPPQMPGDHMHPYGIKHTRLTVKNTGLLFAPCPLIYHLSLYRLWHNLWWYRQWPSVSFWRLYVIEWTLTFNTDWPIVFNARFLFCLLSVIQTAQERFMGRECKCMYACVCILHMHVFRVVTGDNGNVLWWKCSLCNLYLLFYVCNLDWITIKCCREKMYLKLSMNWQDCFLIYLTLLELKLT